MPTYAIAGVIAGANAAHVPVSLSGAATAATTTDANGAFRFPGLAAGAYVVTPGVAGGGASFVPSSVDVAVTNTDVRNLAFQITTDGETRDPDDGGTSPTPSARTLSGVIQAVAGADVSDLTVQLSGAATATVRTDAGGAFSFTGLAAGSYTVRPAGSFKFSPASMNVSIGAADVAGLSFSATPQLTISGTVTPAAGANVSGLVVTLAGDASATTTTNASGGFAFTGVPPGTYTVRPEGGYAYAPSHAAVTLASESRTNLAFTATAYHAISGTVATASGAGVGGIRLALTGTGVATATTDASGRFTFGNLLAGGYTVAVSGSGYRFSPQNAFVNLGSADQAVSFTATPLFRITGTIASRGGANVSGLTVSLSGDASATVTANASGAFTFEGLAPGRYTVTPGGGYVFAPASIAVALSADTSLFFTATALHALTGTVRTQGGAGVGGLTIALGGAATASTRTDDSGNFAFRELAPGSYTIAPSGTGYRFSPASSTASISNADASVSFTALPLYRVTGTLSGTGATGVMVTASANGAVVGTATTDASGAFSIPGLAGGTYTITPMPTSGRSFDPASRTVAVSGDVSGLGFTAGYALTGTTDGVAGVTVSLGSRQVTSDSTGSFAFYGVPDGSYTLSASLVGATFLPASQTVGVNGSSRSVAFTLAHNVSGTISGLPVTATVTLTGGGVTRSIRAGSSFTFLGLADGSYVLTPAATDYTFSPASRVVEVRRGHVTGQNFWAEYQIAGRATAGARVAITAGRVVPAGSTLPAPQTAGPDGSFRFRGLWNGTFTLAVGVPVTCHCQQGGGAILARDLPATAAAVTVNGATVFLSGTLNQATCSTAAFPPGTCVSVW